MTPLAPSIQAFLTDYLTGQRRLSPNTIHAYRDTIRLLLQYLSSLTTTPVCELEFDQVTYEHVTGFLADLETSRGNSVSTRNARLAAIHSWCHYAARQYPGHLADLARLTAIPIKKHPKTELTWLSDEESEALLATIGQATWTARRDHAMLMLAIHSGLRVSEITSLQITDLQVAKPAHVACRGKGRKNRVTPLAEPATTTLTGYLTERQTKPGTALFSAPGGRAMSTDAVSQRLALHLTTARRACPTLAGKHVTMHTLRHTAAMRFLTAGIDTSVIALWLGHENVATTGIYLHADLTIKQRALDRTRPPGTPPGPYQPDDTLLTWLNNL